ncbi:MAG TPA: hypothetical protein VLS89_06325 [Candidatus Nanopelagicales bacterium]|nr:hypothetical protein [Candidatus Nanopelagicales bacterium]
MTGDEIAARLRGGAVVLAFDTNAVHADKRLIALCNLVSRHNIRLTGEGRAPVRLVISTVAYAEKLFDLKQRWRGAFDIGAILEGLRSKGIEVQPFDARHALETAARLGERYPDDAAWQRAKRDRCLHCLGLPPGAAQAPGTGRTCGATVDWLIGGHARAEGCVLVTDDQDPELSGTLERVGLDALEAALRKLAGEA